MAYKIKNSVIIEKDLQVQRINSTISTSFPTWQTSVSYTVNEVVEQSLKLYRCIVSHTAGTFATDLALNWVEISAGVTSANLKDWTTATAYSIDDIVKNESRVYRATTAHTSGTFNTDRANWEVIVPLQAISPWSAATYYYEGETLNVSGRVFRCNTSHTSNGGNFGVDELTNWDRVDNISSSLDYQGSFYYYQGEQITNNKKIYRRIAAGTSGLLFDVTEQANWELVSDVLPVQRISTTQIALVPGHYDLDTSGGSFDITLTNEIGTWSFYNTNKSLTTNSATLKSTGLTTFTNELGVQIGGDFVLNISKEVTVLHTELGDTYRISVDDAIVAPTTFTPNGAWNAATNTPNMNTATNRVDGSTYYVYYITDTGTQDLGNGAEAFQAGGRIEWFSTTVYNYTAPSSVAATLTQVQVEDSANLVPGQVTGQRLSQATAAHESGITYSYTNAIARLAQTGYVITANDIAKQRLFRQIDNNTLWLPTGTVGTLAWVQLGASTQLDRISVHLLNPQTTNLGVGDHITYDTTGYTEGVGNIILDSTTPYTATGNANSIGRFSLKAGFTYSMRAYAGFNFSTAASAGAIVWRNADMGAEIGARAQGNNFSQGGNINNVAVIDTFFKPTIDTRVEVMLINATNVTNIEKSWASIEQLA